MKPRTLRLAVVARRTRSGWCGPKVPAGSLREARARQRWRQTRRSLTIPASRRGYRQALRLARRHAPGPRAWALEGLGSYGAGARFLCERGERVLEVERPAREGSRGSLKSDALDALGAARQLLAGAAGALPHLSAETQTLRALLTTREGAVSACTAALNELRALLLSAPPELREVCGGSARRRCSTRARACGRAGAIRSVPRWHSPCARSPAGCASCARRPAHSRKSSLAACRRSLPSSWPAAGWGRSRRPRCSSPGHSPAACARRPPSPAWPGWHRSRPARARSSATGWTAAAIGV